MLLVSEQRFVFGNNAPLLDLARDGADARSSNWRSRSDIRVQTMMVAGLDQAQGKTGCQSRHPVLPWERESPGALRWGFHYVCQTLTLTHIRVVAWHPSLERPARFHPLTPPATCRGPEEKKHIINKKSPGACPEAPRRPVPHAVS